MRNLTYILLIFILFSCVKERTPVEEINIGSTDVDLNAHKSIVRTQEAVLGNLIADAQVNFAKQRGHNVDFAIVNGGSIRHNTDNRPSGIYPKGIITSYDAEEIIPFFEYGSVVNVSGTELISIFERSAARIESVNGGFLQVSSEIELAFDLNQQPQLIDNTVFPVEIAQEGSRLTSLKINGDTLDVNKIYSVFTNSFLALGGDEYVAFRKISDSDKTEIEEVLVNSFIEYLGVNSPVNPQIENRITIIP